MKTSFIAILLAATFLVGCTCLDHPVYIGLKGNLALKITAPKSVDLMSARIYVDDVFVSNYSRDLPVLDLAPGPHDIRVELEGVDTFERKIQILGEPNHQLLVVRLQKK